jgi:hypothetical protein
MIFYSGFSESYGEYVKRGVVVRLTTTGVQTLRFGERLRCKAGGGYRRGYLLFPLKNQNTLGTTDLQCKHDGNAMETRLREFSGGKEFWRSLKFMCIMLRGRSLGPTSVRRTDRLESTRNPKGFFSQSFFPRTKGSLSPQKRLPEILN